MNDLGVKLVAYASVFGLYVLLALAAIVASRQTRYAGLIFAFLALGLVLMVAQTQYSAIGADFVTGCCAGICVGVGAVLALAAYRMRAGAKTR